MLAMANDTSNIISLHVLKVKYECIASFHLVHIFDSKQNQMWWPAEQNRLNHFCPP